MKPISIAALLATAVVGSWGGAGQAQMKSCLPIFPGGGAAGAGGVVFADGDDEPPPARDEAKREEKKDPNDIRSALDNLGMVRDIKKLAKPVQKGLWEQFVNQPYYTPEMKAARQLFHGQYEDAERAYGSLLKKAEKPEDKVKFQIGLMASVLNQGRDADLERFDKMVPELPEDARNSPKVLTLRARALVDEGKAPEAEKLLRKYVEEIKDLKPIDGDVLAMLNLYGELLERESSYPAAKVLYARIKKLAEEGEQLPEDSLVRTEVVRATYREGVLSSDKRVKQWSLKQLADIFERDTAYWPAYLLSGKILLDAHNEQQGGKSVNDVMQRNPNNLDALYFSFDHAVEGYAFENAERILEDLKDRTESARVLACEGRLLLKKRTPDKALAPLIAAVKKDPTMPEARGWLAATYYLLNDKTKATEQLDAIKVEEHLHPVAAFEMAEVLRDARQFPEAEKLYIQSKKFAAWWSEPSAGLGQLYLELGNEDDAKTELDASYGIDPGNIRAVNQLRLLEEYMKNFRTFKSSYTIDNNPKMPRVIVKCSPQDEILAKLALEWMDRIYPEVTSYFKHTPAVPTIIEFFPNHDQFSVRTTGLPWIGTVGACTGNVIAMDVPRGQAKNMMGPFDWARVLRHEFTHTVTLSMTGNRIPHWLTEAAACVQEHAPRDWDNCQLLASNYRTGSLFSLDTLTWGFIRPKRSIDRHLAYMQSQWVYEYLVEAFGQPKMLEFLAAFRDGKTEAQAYRDVYGKPADQIDKDFRVWAAKQIESWGLPSEILPKKGDLEKKIAQNDKDVESRFYMAWITSMEPGGLAKAKDMLEAATKIDPTNTKVRELLGAILNSMSTAGGPGKPPNAAMRAQAKEMLTKVAEEDPKRVVALRTLGLIAMSEKDYANAEKWLLKLQERRPSDDTSFTRLAGLYLSKNQAEKAETQFALMQAHEQHDEIVPRMLATLYQKSGKLADAQESAYRAIRINPFNAVNHHLLAQIYMAESGQESDDAKKKELVKKAAEYWGYASELQPQILDFWVGLAEANGTLGDLDAASAAAKKAEEIKPNSPAKKWIK